MIKSNSYHYQFTRVVFNNKQTILVPIFKLNDHLFCWSCLFWSWIFLWKELLHLTVSLDHNKTSLHNLEKLQQYYCHCSKLYRLTDSSGNLLESCIVHRLVSNCWTCDCLLLGLFNTEVRKWTCITVLSLRNLLTFGLVEGKVGFQDICRQYP